MVEWTLKVEGMSCENCVRHVREAIESLEGVESAEVSLATNSARVTHQNASLESILAALEQEGYRGTLA